MCSHNLTATYFLGTALIALLSIFYVWMGRKYKVTYYNSLLLGWFLYFVLILVLQQYEREQYKMEIYKL